VRGDVSSSIGHIGKTNTGDVYLGEKGVVLASAERGILLEPGKSVSIGGKNEDDGTDLEDYEVDVTVNTDEVSVTYIAKDK